MFLDRGVGPLSDLKGRTWDAPMVLSLVQRRVNQYADLGLTRSDRVFLHHGNLSSFSSISWPSGNLEVARFRLTPG